MINRSFNVSYLFRNLGREVDEESNLLILTSINLHDTSDCYQFCKTLIMIESLFIDRT